MIICLHCPGLDEAKKGQPNVLEDLLAPVVQEEDVPHIEDEVFAQDAGERLANPLSEVDPERNYLVTSKTAPFISFNLT